MGRKSTKKVRKIDLDKQKEWAKHLFPFFQEHGLEGITIDQMAVWLKKSKSTLYEYFNSKEEIIQLSLLNKLEDMLPYKDILTNNALNYTDRYQQFMKFISIKVSDISNRFLLDLKAEYPETWKLIQFFLEELLKMLRKYYQGGIDKNEFKKIHIAILLQADKNFIFEILTNPAFLIENNLTLKELVEQYLVLRLGGLKN